MLLTAIADELAAQALGTPGVTLFEGAMPDQPDGCVALYGYAGRPPAFEHDEPRPALRFPRLQVLSRDADYAAAEARAQAAYAALCAVVNRQIGDALVLRIAPLQEPFSLGLDGAGRWTIACNYEITY